MALQLYGSEVRPGEYIKELLRQGGLMQGYLHDAQDPRDEAGQGNASTDGQLGPETTVRPHILQLFLHHSLALAPENATQVIDNIRMNRIARCNFYADQRRGYYTAGVVERWPGLVFKGRDWSDARVNYNLIVEHGLHALLHEIYATHLGSRTFSPAALSLHLATALECFACWNPALFPELTWAAQGRIWYRQIAPGSHLSTIDMLKNVDGLRLPTPLRLEHRDQACELVFRVVQERISTKCPRSSSVSQSINKGSQKNARRSDEDSEPTVDQPKVSADTMYPLREAAAGPYASRYSFLDQLKASFSSAGPDATSEQLESALEVQIYPLAKQEPEAFPELFGASAEHILPSRDSSAIAAAVLGLQRSVPNVQISSAKNRGSLGRPRRSKGDVMRKVRYNRMQRMARSDYGVGRT